MPIEGVVGFFDDKDLAHTVTIHGPGLPAEGKKAPAWAARSYPALQRAFEDAYREAGYPLMPTSLGTIKKTWSTGDAITAATEFAPLAEEARVTGLDVTATIAAQQFMPDHMLIPGLEGLFFDDKDLAHTVTIHGPGLPEVGVKAPAWAARSYLALQKAFEDAYREAGFSIMPMDIGLIAKSGCACCAPAPADVVTAATDFAPLAEAARTTNLELRAKIAARVFGAII
jgi:hypothetical protein